MENDRASTTGGINGIDLNDYIPNYRSFNSVVYYHKDIVNNPKPEKATTSKKNKQEKFKSKTKKQSSSKHDKGHQINFENRKALPLRVQILETGQYIPVLENTAELKKNLVPLLIPAVKKASSETIYYTIKAKKHKKQDHKPQEQHIENDNRTYNKEKSKKSEPVHFKEKIHSCSGREFYDPASQNTLDDLHLNINQSSSFSEASEVKYRKKDKEKIINNSTCKYMISNSFDALASESMSGDCNRIKIQLMNESDKNAFRDNIKNPILNTIKEYLSEIANSSDLSADFKMVHKSLKSTNEKMDSILHKLTYLEAKIDAKENQTTKAPHARLPCKAPKLEELNEGLTEVKEDKSSEEEFTEDLEIRKRRIKTRNKSVVVTMDEKLGKELGCGEDLLGPLQASSSVSQMGVKPDRLNRIPARFCWTDADRIK